MRMEDCGEDYSDAKLSINTGPRHSGTRTINEGTTAIGSKRDEFLAVRGPKR